MCTFGKPPGRVFKTSMKTGNWAVSFVWIGLIEVELSTMKTMSRFRLMACWNRSLVFDDGAGSGFASRRALHAQSAGIAAASTTQRAARQLSRCVDWSFVIGILLRVCGGHCRPGGGESRAIIESHANNRNRRSAALPLGRQILVKQGRDQVEYDLSSQFY